MTVQQKRLVGLWVILAGVLGYQFYLGPRLDLLKQQQQQIHQLQTQILQQQALSALPLKNESSQKHLFLQEPLSVWMNELLEMADDTSVVIQRKQFLKAKTHKGFEEYPVHLKLYSTYPNLMMFLQHLEQHPRLFHMKSLHLINQGLQSSNPQLQVSIKGSLYSLK